ncbi:hypothetical protein D918_02994 [Trichuris suis]|nr:hypothetical protein D918_02994 [Trichuris suis]
MSHGMDSCVTNDSALLGLDLTFSSSISVLSTIKTLLILPDFICQQSPVCFAKFNALSSFSYLSYSASENAHLHFLNERSLREHLSRLSEEHKQVDSRYARQARIVRGSSYKRRTEDNLRWYRRSGRLRAVVVAWRSWRRKEP